MALTAGMLLHFCEGRPVSATAEEYLARVSQELSRAGKQALFLFWDNAPWHTSARMRGGPQEHDRQVRCGEKEKVCLIACYLPKRSPWLNPTEPKWLHGKRAVAEPEAALNEAELMARVHEHFNCPVPPLLK